jgi:small subunit ribosomal protein S6
LWNEQKLAYPINGQRKGTYWLTYFKLDGSKLSEFNNQLRINETVMRQLTVKVEPRLVDALVSHARGAKSMVKPPEPRPMSAVAGMVPAEASNANE